MSSTSYSRPSSAAPPSPMNTRPRSPYTPLYPRPRGASRSNTPINARDRGPYGPGPGDDGSQAIYEMLANSNRHHRRDDQLSSDAAIARAIAEDELFEWSARNSPRPPSQASARSPPTGMGIGLGHPGRSNTPAQMSRQRSDSAPQRYQIWRPPSAADVRTVPRAPSRSSMSTQPPAATRHPDQPQYGSPLRYPSDGSGPPPPSWQSDQRPTSPVVIPQRTSSRVSGSRPINLPGSTATTYPPSRPTSTAPRYERRPVTPATNGAYTNGGSRSGTPAMDMASRPHSRASAAAAAAANAANPRYAPDEVIARRLARAWNVESLQPDIISEAVQHHEASHYRSVSNPLPPSGLSMSRPWDIPESSPLIEDDDLVDDRGSPPTSRHPHPHPHPPRSTTALLPIPPSPQPSGDGSRDRSRTRTSTPSRNGTSTPASSNVNHRVKTIYPLIEDDVDTSRPDVVLLHFRDLFVGSRSCPRCGTAIVSQHQTIDLAGYKCPPIALVDFLHARCSSCSTISCRGCSITLPCPHGCSGRSRSCHINSNSCCPEGRAIAVFETLGSFDDGYREHARIVGGGGGGSSGSGSGSGRAARQAFNELVVSSRTVSSTAEWEKMIVGAMKTLEVFLKTPDQDEDDVDVGGSGGGDYKHHPSVKHLFLMSCLPEVLESLLGNRNVSDWVAHSDVYCAVLSTLKCMSNSGLTDLLKDPLPKINESEGIGCWMRGEGEITWQAAEGGVGSGVGVGNGVGSGSGSGSGSNGSGSGSGGSNGSGVGSGGTGTIAKSPPVYEAVKGLERHRRPLLELASKIQFPATVKKIQALCDGILYLLLQQMMI